MPASDLRALAGLAAPHGSGRGRGCRPGDTLWRPGWRCTRGSTCSHHAYICSPSPVSTHPAATPPPVHACMHYTSGQRRCPLLPGAGQAAEAHSLAPTDDSFQDHEWNNCQKLREKKQAPRLLYTDTACVRACDSCRQPRFGHKLSSIIRDKTSNCLYGKRGSLSPIQKNKQLRR